MFESISEYKHVYKYIHIYDHESYEPSDDTPRTSIILTTHYACKNAGKPFW